MNEQFVIMVGGEYFSHFDQWCDADGCAPAYADMVSNPHLAMKFQSEQEAIDFLTPVVKEYFTVEPTVVKIGE